LLDIYGWNLIHVKVVNFASWHLKTVRIIFF
jgi:putative addiction module killer protein/probable addiction module antidote protein